MKRFYAIVLAIFYLQYAFAQSANKSLSNLNDTTAINVTILPGVDNSINIGSALRSWKNLYLDGSIYIGGQKFISNKSGTGTENTAIGTLVLASATTGYQNTGVGYHALNNNTTGSQNTANGYYALRGNVTGYYNTANGSKALRNNTYGNSNTANGSSTLYYNTVGDNNTANGTVALYNNTFGNNNTANGVSALYHNTSGNDNTANGTSTLYYNTTGGKNTASGAEALYANTTGYSNTANGANALHDNTTGYRNTANGSNALTSNTTGYFNTANGTSSLDDNTTGYANTASGLYALSNNTAGNYNTADGVEALYDNTTGNYNTGCGRRALFKNTIGNFNTAIGYYADVSTGGLSNATALGYGAVVNASNKVRIGNTSVTSIGGQVNWTTFSDGRYKKNIQEDVKGLAFINALRPVTYTTDIKALDAYFMGRNNDNAYKNMQADVAVAAAEGSKIIYTGFVAQEVEAAAKKLGYDFSGVDKPKTKEGIYGLRYSDFVVPLVKAVQELSMKNDEKEEKINNLQKQVDELTALIVSKQAAAGNNQAAAMNGTLLEQNIPNPFSNTTTIAYSLPAAFSSAKIIVTDMNGKQLKQLNISGSGKGVVHIDASTLASGAYYYSLYIDGRLNGSKKMIRN